MKSILILIKIVLMVFCLMLFFWNGKFDICLLAKFIILFLIADVIQDIVHEAGHFVGGILSSHSFLKLKLGIVCIEYDRFHKKWGFGIEPRKGNQCIMIPNSDSLILYNISGIIANVILTIISMIGCFFTDYKMIFISVMVLGIFKVITNALPIDCNGYPTDGKITLNVRQSEKYKNAYFRYLRCYEKYYWDLPFYVAESDLSDTYFDNKTRELLDAYG